MGKEISVKKVKKQTKTAAPAAVVAKKVVAVPVAAPVKAAKKSSKKAAKVVAAAAAESDEETKVVVPVVVAPVESSSDSSSSSSSEDEAPAPVAAPVAVAAPVSESLSDSDSSSEDEVAAPVAAPVVAAKSDSSDSDSSSSDEESAPAAAAAIAAKEESGSDSSDSSDSDSDSSDEEAAAPVKRKAETDAAPAKKQKVEVAETSETDTTVFVGNLSWNVTEDQLAETFAECGPVKSTRIITDRDTGRPKGFGYVEFESAADAVKAIALTGREVDGRELRVDISTPKPARVQNAGGAETPTSPPSAILFLGNLSFNVTEEEIRSTFGEHGTVVSCRFPTDRETGAFKGFGYLEFSSVEEATSAVNGLNGQNISGRPIRIDYSKPRDDSAGGAPRGGRGGFGGGRGGGGRGGGRGGARGGFGGGGRGGAAGGRGGGRGGFAARPSGTKTTF